MTDKPKRISKKIQAAIEAIVDGSADSVTSAAETAGLSREHLSRELSRPHIAEHLRPKVLRRLALASARAGDTKIKLLDSDNELVRDRAYAEELGRRARAYAREHFAIERFAADWDAVLREVTT